MSVALLCVNGLEECEALVTRDLLIRSGIEVLMLGESKTIKSSHNLTFECDDLISNYKDDIFEAIILPGGMPGTLNLEANDDVQHMIDNHIANNAYVAAICAAPSILLHKELLNDNEFTCYPGFEGELIRKEEKCVKTGKFITACGLGGVNEFAYEIISSLKSKKDADDVFKKILF